MKEYIGKRERPRKLLSNKSLVQVLIFTLFYILVACVLSLVDKNYEFGIYIGEMLVLILLIWHVHSRVGLPLSLLWCLSIWGFLHLAGGLAPVPEAWPIKGEHRVLYSLWLLPSRLKYDQVVHAYGFGVTTWVCWQGIKSFCSSMDKELEPTVGKLTIAAAAGMGFGALNEVVEFLVTLIVPSTNVGGYMNTGWDLVANLIGSIVAVAVIRWRYLYSNRYWIKSN